MRASLNTIDYLRNVAESSKIEPLEQWGPLLAPWDYCAGQHGDRRHGVQVSELHGGMGWGERIRVNVSLEEVNSRFSHLSPPLFFSKLPS